MSRIVLLGAIFALFCLTSPVFAAPANGASTMTVYALFARETTSPTTAQDLRQRLLNAGYRLEADGPLGTNPGLWMNLSTPGPLTNASRTLRTDNQAGVPVVGQYWTEIEANTVANELDLRGGIQTEVVPVTVTVEPIPGTNGRYVETRIPVLSGQQVAATCSTKQEGVYVRDTQTPGDSPRSTVFLGVACSGDTWDSQVRATSVDPATFTVYYMLHGDFRSITFPEDPRPLYGHPAELEDGALIAVQKAFPKVDPSALRVFGANGYGLAYIWTRSGGDNGTVKTWVVRHNGEIWEKVRQLPGTLTMSKAAFQQSPPAMSDTNYGSNGQAEPWF